MYLLPYLSLFVFAIAAASNSDNETAHTCDSLAAALSDRVSFPDSDTYNKSIASYPFIQLRLHPACVVRPTSPQDVAKTVNILRDTGCTKFAVRGGGHNANKGFNNVEDGVTIDLRSLNAVDLHEGEEVTSVGAGAIWQEVYDVLEPLNKTVLGGRIGVVGVGGFITGGGISFYSPEHGWSCDSVENFEVVLASGDIVNVNATSRTDLFAALKGGQSNFGIVTRFDLKTYPSGPMWGGRIAYAPTADTALISAFTQFKSGPYDPYAAGWVTVRYNGTAKSFIPTSILWYTKPEKAPGALGNITSVQPQVFNGMLNARAADFARNASMVVKNSNSRTIWATTTFHISPTIVHRIYKVWKELTPKICETYSYAQATSELTFQSLAPPPRNGSQPNSLGFKSEFTPEKDLVFLQIIFYFQDAGATDGLNNALKDFIALFDELIEQEGVKHRYLYLNFAAWFQDPLGAYGKEQLQKLRTVAKTYDSNGFFQKQLAGGFKLF